MALDEFVGPAFAAVKAEYMERLEQVCSKEPWAANKISALANAGRILDEVRSQIFALVIDGEDAKAKKSRAQHIEELTPAKRRLLQIGPF